MTFTTENTLTNYSIYAFTIELIQKVTYSITTITLAFYGKYYSLFAMQKVDIVKPHHIEWISKVLVFIFYYN